MQLVSASTKLRQMFYKQIERRSYHTAWVKTGKARCEHMFSASPLRADIAMQSACPFRARSGLIGNSMRHVQKTSIVGKRGSPVKQSHR